MGALVDQYGDQFKMAWRIRRERAARLFPGDPELAARYWEADFGRFMLDSQWNLLPRHLSTLEFRANAASAPVNCSSPRLNVLEAAICRRGGALASTIDATNSGSGAPCGDDPVFKRRCKTEDDAAREALAAARYLTRCDRIPVTTFWTSLKEVEYCGLVYRIPPDTFSFTQPIRSSTAPDSCNFGAAREWLVQVSKFYPSVETLGSYHSHPPESNGLSLRFSLTDLASTEQNRKENGNFKAAYLVGANDTDIALKLDATTFAIPESYRPQIEAPRRCEYLDLKCTFWDSTWALYYEIFPRPEIATSIVEIAKYSSADADTSCKERPSFWPYTKAPSPGTDK
jgi:hypothetical protein